MILTFRPGRRRQDFFMERGLGTYYLLLHITVFIFGFTGILGKQITSSDGGMDSVNLVLYRMVIAFIGLLLYMKLVKRIKFKAGKKAILGFIGIGAIIAAHWITFFYSIQVSNVSIALACISSSALFTSIIEPLLIKKKIDVSEMVLGVATVVGISIIVDAEMDKVEGIILAIISAALAGLFGVLNSIETKKHRPTEISVVEMLSGAFFTFLFLIISGWEIVSPADVSSDNWGLIIVLGLVATSFAFVATVEVMKVLSPFTVALSINLEPIYAIIMALLFFPESEQMSSLFYLGAGIIIGTLIVNALIKKSRRKKLNSSESLIDS